VDDGQVVAVSFFLSIVISSWLKLVIRTDKETVDPIFSIVDSPYANYLILASKYNYHTRTRSHLAKYTTSPELGLQQRAVMVQAD
jgi:hypothetical protein